jgi:hypothetical protein
MLVFDVVTVAKNSLFFLEVRFFHFAGRSTTKFRQLY